MARRADDAVMGHGVVVGAVKMLRPFVDAGGPWFDCLGPCFALLDASHAQRCQHAHDLRHGNLASVLDDNQIHQIVHIGQALAVEQVDRNRAVQARRLDGGPRLFDVGRRGVQTLNDNVVARSQRGGQLAGPAAQMDDEAALDHGGVIDGPRILRGPRAADPDMRENTSSNHQQNRQSSVHHTISFALKIH